MLRFTVIHRISDGNPLCESIDEGDKSTQKQVAHCKSQVKDVLSGLASQAGPGRRGDGSQGTSQASISAGGGYMFHYVVRGDVVYLAASEKAFNSDLALHYLHRIADEFEAKVGVDAVAASTRPFCFIDFEPSISRAQEQYNRDVWEANPDNARKISEMAALNAELNSVSSIMSQNIEDVLLRGERLESVYEKSTRLRDSSARFVKQTKHLNWLALWRTYGPLAVVALILLAVVFVYFFW